LKGQRPLTNEIEARHGLVAPIQCYPLFENALRAAAGRSLRDHQAFLGALMARNTAVAARNPFAWFPTQYTPDEVALPSADNRWVCFPYPKRMNAVMEVDLSAAIVVMSDEEAQRRGVAAHHRVAVLGGGSAVDAWTPTERIDFTSSPAIRRASGMALDHAGITVADVDRFDLYSCFPSAVELALGELGVAADDPRGVTVTGGLAYAGGPGNSYSMHGLAAMTEVLRAAGPDPDPSASRTGLVSALGMTATKHSYAVLSVHPDHIVGADGLGEKVTLPEAERTGPALVDGVSGEGALETYTVEYGRDGAAHRSVLVVRLDDGTRTVTNGVGSPEEIRALTDLSSPEPIGRRVRVTGGTPGEGEANVVNRGELLG
jgi:acetyl-CoA C-acetyltransferase